jgi:hypothetical protein
MEGLEGHDIDFSARIPLNYKNLAISFLPDIVDETPQGDNKDGDIDQDDGAGFNNGFFHANRMRN